jgi:myo-inositol-1(or 4)-monophosphatase
VTPDQSGLSARFFAAEAMARQLGVLAMSYFTDEKSLGISMKGSQDWLTEADGRVETAFRAMIAATFPDDTVMGEEQGGATGEALWIIDPIDGTANFARGDRSWCVSIGFLANGVPTLGVIYAPALGEMWLARVGHGATLNGAPIRCSSTTDMARASVEVGWSPRRPIDDYLALVGDYFRKGASVKRSASGALGLAHVANGRTDAYAELHINAWDVAAGVVIAAEAGAILSPFFTGDWAGGGNPIVAVTPPLASDIMPALGL